MPVRSLHPLSWPVEYVAAEPPAAVDVPAHSAMSHAARVLDRWRPRPVGNDIEMTAGLSSVPVERAPSAPPRSAVVPTTASGAASTAVPVEAPLVKTFSLFAGLPVDIAWNIFDHLTHPSRPRREIMRDLKALVTSASGTADSRAGNFPEIARRLLTDFRMTGVGASVTHPKLIGELIRQIQTGFQGDVDALRNKACASALRHGIAHTSMDADDVTGRLMPGMTHDKRAALRRQASIAAILVTLTLLGFVSPGIVLSLGGRSVLDKGLDSYLLIAGIVLFDLVVLLPNAALSVQGVQQDRKKLSDVEAMVLQVGGAIRREQLAEGGEARDVLDVLKAQAVAVLCPLRTEHAGPSVDLLCAAATVNLDLPTRAKRFHEVMWPELDNAVNCSDRLALLNEMLLDRAAPLSFVGLAPLSPGNGTSTAMGQLERLVAADIANNAPAFARALRALGPHIDRAAPAERFDALQRLLASDRAGLPSAIRDARNSGRGWVHEVGDDQALASILRVLGCVRISDLDANQQAWINDANRSVHASRPQANEGMSTQSATRVGALARASAALTPEPRSAAAFGRRMDEIDVLRLTCNDDDQAVQLLSSRIDYLLVPAADRRGCIERMLGSLSRQRTENNDLVIERILGDVFPYLPLDDLLPAVQLLRPAMGSECFNSRSLIWDLDRRLRLRDLPCATLHDAIASELRAMVEDFPALMMTDDATKPPITRPLGGQWLVPWAAEPSAV